MSIRSTAFCLLLVVVAQNGSDAALILSESFDYPDGTLEEGASERWTGHSGTDGQVEVLQGRMVLTGAESQDVNATLEGGPYASGSVPFLFCGFKVRFTEIPAAKGTYFAHFKDGRSGFRGRIWARASAETDGMIQLGISSGSGTAADEWHGATVTLETDHWVVCRLATADIVATLWLDPESQQSPSVSSGGGANLEISAFAFRQSSGMGGALVDDLRVGTEFEDVYAGGQPVLVETPPDPVIDGGDPGEPGISVPPETPNEGSAVPVISRQPDSSSVLAGSAVSFSVAVEGEQPFEYQWRFNDSDIAGANGPELVVEAIGAEQEGGYRVVVSNARGTATSAAAVLTVIDPPVITVPPRSLAVREGQDIALSVVVTGTEPFTYQWRFNGEPIEGASSSTLVMESVSVEDSGDYTVLVENVGGETVSAPASLIVSVIRLPEISFSNELGMRLRLGDQAVNTFAEQSLIPGETLAMNVVVMDPKSRLVTVRIKPEELPESASWKFSETMSSEWTGVFEFSPTEADSGMEFVTSIEAENGDGTIGMEWSIYVPTAAEQGVRISEFLANPATSGEAPHFNPLNRLEPAPNPSSNDEFLELINRSSAEIDLTGWTISDSIAVRHQFVGPTVLDALGAMVVYGGPSDGFVPQLPVSAVPANGGVAGLALNNSGGDAIVVRNADGRLIERVVYSSPAPNASLTRVTDANEMFVSHTDVSGFFVSPGLDASGEPFGMPVPSEPAPISLRAWIGEGRGLHLEWNSEAGRVYSVLESSNVDGPFAPVAEGLGFEDGLGSYLVGAGGEGSRFFRVIIP